MRRLLATALGVALAATGGAVAFAQATWPSVTVTPKISPATAGTPKHPQAVQLKTLFHWQSLGEASQPIVTSFTVLFPKGSLYGGGSITKCSLSAVSKGPQACPKASIVGVGSGTAYADTTITHPQITVVNGGASTVYFYTVLNNPARVQEPVIGRIHRVGGKWSYSLAVTVPDNLRIVAGVPIELTSLSVTAGGRGHGAWLATTACSGGHWPFSVTTSYENPNTGATGSSSYSAKTPCRK
jgi:hypothetical protein